MVTVSIIEDDAYITELYMTFFKESKQVKLVSVSGSVEAFLKKRESVCSRVILLDIGLPGIDGVQGCALIRQKCPDSEILMVTVHQSVDYIFQALRNGASGYVLKDIDLQELLRAVKIIASGGSFMSPPIARKVINYFSHSVQPSGDTGLTERESSIVKLLKDGLSYKMISAELNISLDTVRSHIKNIYKKLQVHSRAEVVRKTYLE